MQIKPHQAAHFAEQQRRFKSIRLEWQSEAEEEGSYFSKTLKAKPNSIQLMNYNDAGIELKNCSTFQTF